MSELLLGDEEGVSGGEQGSEVSTSAYNGVSYSLSHKLHRMKLVTSPCSASHGDKLEGRSYEKFIGLINHSRTLETKFMNHSRTPETFALAVARSNSGEGDRERRKHSLAGRAQQCVLTELLCTD